MGKDYRYSKDDVYDRDEKFFGGRDFEDNDRAKRHKKRVKSALTRKQRQQQAH